MPYNYKLEDLLAIVRRTAPATADAVAVNRRTVRKRLSPVGLKVHVLDDGRKFDPLVHELGGRGSVLEINHYKDTRASICLVLPPVGSAQTAIHLLECLQAFTGVGMFNNRDVQLQVCSPGRLDPKPAAILAIGFYLSSDVLRRYTQADLRTTFATHFTYPRGIRLVLWDAGGTFEKEFAFWNAHGVLEPELPFNNRSDVLIGAGYRNDILNINLMATLLAHMQYGGFWQRIGELFFSDFIDLLTRHDLLPLLAVQWVRSGLEAPGEDDRFFSALQVLVAYALEESVRVRKRGLFPIPRRWVEIPARSGHGILGEVQAMLNKYRAMIDETCDQLDRGVRS